MAKSLQFKLLRKAHALLVPVGDQWFAFINATQIWFHFALVVSYTLTDQCGVSNRSAKRLLA